MLTRQLSLCASKRWPFLSLKNMLTTAPTSNTPKLAAGVKRRCACQASQAAASNAAESGTPASFVFSAARELADAGVSAAGLATYAEKASRYRHNFFCLNLCPVKWLLGVLVTLHSTPVCSRIPFLLRCRMLDISGNDANPLADCLLSFGALSAR